MSEALMGNPFYDNPTFTKSKFDSEKRKWEFRYENQDRRLKEMESTIKDLRKKNRELMKQINV